MGAGRTNFSVLDAALEKILLFSLLAYFSGVCKPNKVLCIMKNVKIVIVRKRSTLLV